MRISTCFPTLLNLGSENLKKAFFLKKKKLSDILKISCKSFSMKFVEVNNFLRNYWQYFAKEVEQNFMKEFSCEQKKKIQYNLWNKIEHSSYEIHYFTVFATAKLRSEPAVVARLGVPDFAELGFVDFV